MQIVDTALLKAKEEGRAVRVGIVGAGYSAKRILYQIVDGVAGMDVVALGNRTVDNAVQAMQFAGINDYKIVSSLAAMDVAIQNGQRVVAEDPALVWQSPHVDVVVDATGSVEFGAHIALGAIENKKHIVLMNVELDATVGPILKNKADHAGVIYSNSDGDEPGVAMNMIRFVKSLGLQPVLAGNLKGLYDPYRNPTTQVEFAKANNQLPKTMAHFADGTKLSMELSVLGNAAGWGVACRGMYGPKLEHVNDAPAYFLDKVSPENLTEHTGLVDFLVGAAPSNGAFVLGYSQDPIRADFLQYLKMGEGPLYVFYTPFHLPQLEIPNTIARAALLADATVAPMGKPTCDSIAVAKKDLFPGEVLDGMGGYCAYALIENYQLSVSDDLLPIGVSEGCVVRRAVPKDQALIYADVEVPQGRLVDQLRVEQNAMF